MLLLLSLLVLLLPNLGQTSAISCYNDQGVATDWFYLYKLPKEGKKVTPDKGLLYLLLDKGDDGWTKGQWTVNDSRSALGSTMGQLYTQNKNGETAFILYNDQPVVSTDRKKLNYRSGHTKGVVLLDKQQGFWLVHSTPHFPPMQRAGEFSYPCSGMNNGQNFLCITFPLQSFQTIGEQLQINQPTVYDCKVPDSLAALVPSLAALCHKNSASNLTQAEDKPVSNRSVTLTSEGGTDFISFAKGATFNNDLYHAWVAPTLQSDLLVQCWVRSTGVLPSDCSLGWKVLKITLIFPASGFNFSNTHDHSKWAVSTDAAGGSGPGGGWVCVGDINRDMAEEQRGGGTVCQRDPVVWKAYRTAALRCQMCDGGTDQC